MKYAPYSSSKIATFKQCKKKFLYQYIQKIKIDKPINKALQKGDLIHNLIENTLLKSKIPQKNIFLDRYKILDENDIDNCYKILHDFTKTEIFKSINTSPFKKIIENWFYLNENFEPSNKEKSIICGKIDFITINEKKKIGLIIDWKTGGKNIESLKKYPKELDQLELYSIWGLQKFNLKGIKSKFYFIEHDYEQSEVFLENSVKNIKSKFLTLINEIEECNKYLGNITKLCDYCDFKNICDCFD